MSLRPGSSRPPPVPVRPYYVSSSRRNGLIMPIITNKIEPRGKSLWAFNLQPGIWFPACQSHTLCLSDAAGSKKYILAAGSKRSPRHHPSGSGSDTHRQKRTETDRHGQTRTDTDKVSHKHKRRNSRDLTHLTNPPAPQLKTIYDKVSPLHLPPHTCHPTHSQHPHARTSSRGRRNPHSAA